MTAASCTPIPAILSTLRSCRPASWSGADAEALLLVNLERFKEVNDTLGHHAGDELLVAVATRLRNACRSRDTVARLGGDEFAVLLTGLPAATAAVTMANQLLDRLRQPVVVEGLVVDVDASVGVALAPENGEDVATLLRSADVAMHEAKRTGAGWPCTR